jgi:hypothetical protein
MNSTCRGIFLVFLLIGSFFFSAVPVHASEKTDMNGIYVLPAGEGLKSAAAEAPFVKGYSIRVAWKKLEPRRGRYNWDPIDDILAAARKNGKYVTLRVLAGAESPDWVLRNPEIPKIEFVSRNPNKKKNYNKEVTLPRLWDEKYLNEYYRFLDAMGKRYGAEPLLYWVAVSGPVAGAACPMLPKDRETVRVLKAEGLTQEKWARTWEGAIDRTASAFPGKAISLCLDVPVFYEELAEKLASYAVQKYPGRVCLQSNGLSSKLPAAEARNARFKHLADIFRSYNGKATIGFQMVWAAAWKDRGKDRLGPLDQSIRAGLGLGAAYLEIYQDDITDGANAALLSDTAKKMSVPRQL